MGDAPFYLHIVGGGLECLIFLAQKPLFVCITYFY